MDTKILKEDPIEIVNQVSLILNTVSKMVKQIGVECNIDDLQALALIINYAHRKLRHSVFISEKNDINQ
ncbi:MAG: hypothetical protein PUP46_11145 [Endozoicomonas sp. (ex Botrylloides leachii)]|nr:hypothetical protein [Endozoicomonas sp. (ex Botrylloides leachii)]